MVLHVCSGSYICEFVSGGPKSYSYRVVTGAGEMKEEIKTKGLTLNHSSSKILQFNTLRQLVMDFCSGIEDKKKIYFHQIRRKEGGIVATVATKKDYRVVYNKRVMKSDFSTLPYGY